MEYAKNLPARHRIERCLHSSDSLARGSSGYEYESPQIVNFLISQFIPLISAGNANFKITA